MTSTTSFKSCGEAISHWWQQGSATTVMVSAGIAAVGVYGVGDLVAGLRYDGYSYRDQAISELSAFDSPVRGLMASAIVVHALLLVIFGLGVCRSAHRRSLRLAGLSIVGIGLVGFPTHTVFAMSSRWTESGFNDTMHIALTSAFTLLVAVAMVSSAVAYRGWFRIYTAATLAILIGFGGAAGYAMRGLEEDLTPWVGGFERINAYAYFAWMVVLAVMVLRHPDRPTDSAGTTEREPERLSEAVSR
jgi:hypothetical membrane protein